MNDNDFTSPVDGAIDVDADISWTCSDPDGDDILYLFDWGDGTDSGWIDSGWDGIDEKTLQQWELLGDPSLMIGDYQ